MHLINRYLRALATRGASVPGVSAGRVDAHEAQALWSAVLDGGVAGVEVGALLSALAVAGETESDLLGLHRAIAARSARLSLSLDRRPIAVGLYGLVPAEATFAAMLALFLRRFEVPVVLHGCLDSSAEPSAAVLLRELGVLPCACLRDAEQRLAEQGLAFVPAQLLSPALAGLLSLRASLGPANAAHLASIAMDPGALDAVRLAALVPGTPTAGLAPFLSAGGGDALLLRWPPGETPANLALRPHVTWVSGERDQLLFEAGSARRPPAPVPLVNVAAACVLASGAASDITQAKAIVALQCGRIAA